MPLDWTKIKFDDYKGNPLVYPMKKYITQETKREYNIYYYKAIIWPKMEHRVKYDISVIKSDVKDHDENTLFNCLSGINTIDLKKMIGDYLLVKKIDMTISSDWKGDVSPDGEDEHRRFKIIVEYNEMKYIFDYSTFYNSANLQIVGLKSLATDINVHISCNYSFSDLFEKIKKLIVGTKELDQISDALTVIDTRIKKLRRRWI